MNEIPVPSVVFACVRNGGRSVAARLLTEHYARGRVTALSAGTQPGQHIHAEVAEVLEELGLDTSQEHPTLLTRETIATSDFAITLGCGEECPYVPGVTYRDWPVDDPGGQDKDTVHRIIADLDARVRSLLLELVPGLDMAPALTRRDELGFPSSKHPLGPISSTGRTRSLPHRATPPPSTAPAPKPPPPVTDTTATTTPTTASA